MPTTVRTDSNIRKLPARYISWLISASIKAGPVVGKPNTMDTIASPEMSAGNNNPIVLINGLMAIRSGYLISSYRGFTPLARAVTT